MPAALVDRAEVVSHPPVFGFGIACGEDDGIPLVALDSLEVLHEEWLLALFREKLLKVEPPNQSDIDRVDALLAKIRGKMDTGKLLEDLLRSANSSQQNTNLEARVKGLTEAWETLKREEFTKKKPRKVMQVQTWLKQAEQDAGAARPAR